MCSTMLAQMVGNSYASPATTSPTYGGASTTPRTRQMIAGGSGAWGDGDKNADGPRPAFSSHGETSAAR
jgi:hypothetical protein